MGDPDLPRGSVTLAAALAALGLGAELLSFNQSRESSGSIALVPLTATALVAPHSVTIAMIFAIELVVQVSHRRNWVKSAFNLAQIALGYAIGLLAYRATGGIPFLEIRGESFVSSLVTAGGPAVLLLAAVIIVNTLCVSSIIAFTSGKRLLQVWYAHAGATLHLSALLLLVAFYLTWLSTNLGIIGTLGIAIPIVAVRQLYSKTVEVTTVTEELLDLMVAAIEARDPYTSGHSQRVARASAVIARALDLSAAEIERVTVAALLHDVGKIDEQFAPILAKEGRLTPHEWDIMKRHPIRSAELVGLLTSLRDLVRPIRHHHENWDGTGYPDGVCGAEIPLASRIIMFADTLDAMTTDRPYRKALSMDEARREFIKFRGRQFDPEICDRILAPDVWNELFEATNKGDKNANRLSVLQGTA
jgi:HD-GYP domain-containing protein (c-di-GMP phosphodiesterase class II)